jgi:hypothetical protein
MTKHITTQLEKVLALVESSYDSEAIVAIRKAQQILSRDGLSLSDLARNASAKPKLNLPFGFFSTQNVESNLEAEIVQLQQEIEDLRREKLTHESRTDMWKQRAYELEHKLNVSIADAERWRQLAKETVDKLWDLGQSMQEDVPVPVVAPKVAKSG